MRQPILIFLVLNAIWGASGAAFGAACRTLQGNLRVDSAEIVASLQDVCEIKGGIGIFTEDLREITLPNLVSAGVINVEADGLEAISFPKLKSVNTLVVRGGQVRVLEVPELTRVNTLLAIKLRRLQYLNLPRLGHVGHLNLEGNLDLEFVFADSLYDIRKIQMNNNPLLNKGSIGVLEGVTHTESEEEKEFIRNAKEEIRLLKRQLIDKIINQPPPPPTGHPTYFGMYQNYYAWYPHHLYHYWNSIRPWGYHNYYHRDWYGY